MKLFKALIITTLSISQFACEQTKKNKKKYFSLEISSPKHKIQAQSTINIQLKNTDNAKIDSVVYHLEGKKIDVTNTAFTFTDEKLGKKQLSATVFYEGKKQKLTKQITLFAKNAPKMYQCKVLKTYAHRTTAYTQGLEFYNGKLYESTGKYGKSSLSIINPITFKVEKEIFLAPQYFGEGATVLNNKVYQLTWQNNTGFIYDATSLKKVKTFSYQKSKEGWGLCNDGNKLYKSDGSEKIWILNPETLAEESYIEITSNSKQYNRINELEYVDGLIYANSYQNDGIMIINAKTGALEGVVDCRNLKKQITLHPEVDVLNGIAYHPKTKTFFVTGKNWNLLFEIAIVSKS